MPHSHHIQKGGFPTGEGGREGGKEKKGRLLEEGRMEERKVIEGRKEERLFSHWGGRRKGEREERREENGKKKGERVDGRGN